MDIRETGYKREDTKIRPGADALIALWSIGVCLIDSKRNPFKRFNC